MAYCVLHREQHAPVGQVARCIAACLATFSCNAKSAVVMMSPESPVVSTLLLMLTARETPLFQGERVSSGSRIKALDARHFCYRQMSLL